MISPLMKCLLSNQTSLWYKASYPKVNVCTQLYIPAYVIQFSEIQPGFFTGSPEYMDFVVKSLNILILLY